MTRDDDLYRYYYDCENRLTDVNDKATGNPIASYSYDHFGRRVSKTVDSNTTKYCYSGSQVIAEYDYNDVTTNYELARKFIYGPDIDEPICMIDVADGNTVYYYHFDGLGSIVALSNVNSVIIERYSYDVFGEPNRTSDVNNPYLFTGRHYDPETGLYYYRARYYAYDVGRFLQADPIGYYDSLNLYQYCRNNPINWIDPLGLCKASEVRFLKGGGGVGLIPPGDRKPFLDWLEGEKKKIGRRPKDHYDKEGLRRKYQEWKGLGKPRGNKTKSKKPWQGRAISVLGAAATTTAHVFKTAGQGVLATGEWMREHPAETGIIIVGTGIVIFDVVTVPSGEGAVGVVMIKSALSP